MNYEIVFDNGFWERIATFQSKSDAKKSIKAIVKKDAMSGVFIADYKVRRIKKGKRKDMKFEVALKNDIAWEKIAESENKADAKLILKIIKKADKKHEPLNSLEYKVRKIKKSKK